ncbi:hypothetical protein [Cellulophaga sp. Z1A5H]|uniref:hypothetical protein n=1 Tax=Cellulophaga sp. Z1A5H TaxID=2687291 RepID=UPI0013FDFB06|nr:hypothetical protein [Cellulophaga sp. Z1A5H]
MAGKLNKNGLQIEEWKQYYSNGQLSAIEKYEDGASVGTWKIMMKMELKKIRLYSKTGFNKNNKLHGKLKNQ